MGHTMSFIGFWRRVLTAIVRTVGTVPVVVVHVPAFMVVLTGNKYKS